MYTELFVFHSWIHNELDISMVGEAVDLTYDYDVSQMLTAKNHRLSNNSTSVIYPSSLIYFFRIIIWPNCP